MNGLCPRDAKIQMDHQRVNLWEEYVLRSRIVVRGIVGVIIPSAVLLTRP